ncbi:MAG: class I SAM-dependent methyltransferase [Muribaculum sp.]|nr:class I SAM-dependent methyltransferase [Muribaculum sp.]
MDVKSLPDEFYEWIDAHIADDPRKLLLSWRDRAPWVTFAVLQIECRRKASSKLPDELQCRRFLFPAEISAQQSTSDTLARFHSSLIGSGERGADMTAGLGVDAFHFSALASEVIAVEIDAFKADVLEHNAGVLNIDNLTVVASDCCEYAKELPDNSFDVIFIDPARRADDGSRLFSISQCKPDVLSMIPELKRICPRLIVKLSPMLDVVQTIKELPDVSDIYVTGAVNECKELIAVCDFRGLSCREPMIHVVSPDAKWPEFNFTLSDESEAEVKCGDIHVGDWLYEPSAPVMKAAPWGLLCCRFGLKKLHPNTNLYVSDHRIEGFPGASWYVEAVLPFASGVLKRFSRQWPEINVSVRNFPMTADVLRRKLRVSDISDDSKKVIGVTVCDGKQQLLVLNKL